jgi:hypothetical protein
MSVPEPITREEQFLKEIYDAASGGEMRPMYIHLEPSIEVGDYIAASADKSVDEIIDALSAGRPVWMNMVLNGIDAIGALNGAAAADGEVVVFCSAVNGEGEVYTGFPSPTEEWQNRWLISRYQIPDGMTVLLTADEDNNITSEQTLVDIQARLDNGDRVILEFPHPLYEGFTYRMPVTIWGSDSNTIFIAAQIVDPFSGSLSVLYANGSGSDNNWTMVAYPLTT